jgi:hypothetical protein
MSHVVPAQATPPAHPLLPQVTVQGMPAGHVMAPAHALAVVQSIPQVPFEHVPASQSDAQRACASTIIVPSDGASPTGASRAASPAPPSPAGPSPVEASATSLVGASADASSFCVDPSGPGGSATGLLFPHACARAAEPAAMEMTAATAAKLRTRGPMRDGYTAAVWRCSFTGTVW